MFSALVSYIVERRTKEIGIRKVLGASVLQISALLSKEFLLLVVVSCCLSMPLGWYAMQEWLQNFVYHIDQSLPVVVAAGLSTFVLALTILGIRTIRSASVSPVISLKTE